MNFTNFFAEFWLTAVYWVPPSNMGFQAYCLTFCFFFENVELYFLRLSAPLENRGGLAGGNSKILGPFFFVLVRAGSLNFKNFFAVFWFEAV